MANFNKGDIVELKSGSPKMTVTGYKWNAHSGTYEEDQINCVWFSDSETQYGTFPEEALKKTDSD